MTAINDGGPSCLLHVNVALFFVLFSFLFFFRLGLKFMNGRETTTSFPSEKKGTDAQDKIFPRCLGLSGSLKIPFVCPSSSLSNQNKMSRFPSTPTADRPSAPSERNNTLWGSKLLPNAQHKKARVVFKRVCVKTRTHTHTHTHTHTDPLSDTPSPDTFTHTHTHTLQQTDTKSCRHDEQPRQPQQQFSER